jgi:solute carrier family 25 aspartate/glutamate transporter 12/13
MKGGKHKYKDMRTCFSIILKEEGPTAFFKGVVPRMFVVGPLFGLTLLAFETQKAYMIRNGLL